MQLISAILFSPRVQMDKRLLSCQGSPFQIRNVKFKDLRCFLEKGRLNKDLLGFPYMCQKVLRIANDEECFSPIFWFNTSDIF
jgi:hypothetical protein